MAPWDRLKGERDGSCGRLSPGSSLSTDVLRSLSLVLIHMLRDSEIISESFFDKVNVLSVVLDSRSNNKAFFGSNVVHNELLEDTCIEVTDVVLHSVARHTKGVVTVGCTE